MVKECEFIWDQTYWSDGDKTLTIQEVLYILQDHPIVSLSVKSLEHIPSTKIDPSRKERANLSFPIIVVEKEGGYTMILDGHHRRQKAIESNRTHILSKILKSSGDDIFSIKEDNHG